MDLSDPKRDPKMLSLLIPKLSDFINKTFWIPAFAGMTPLRKQGLTSFYVIPAEAEPAPHSMLGIHYIRNQ